MSTQKQGRNLQVCPKTGKIIKSAQKHSWLKWLFPLTGLLALIWFLIRVIPKPSRALYPCQRITAPIASGFVVWLLGLLASAAAFHRAKHLLAKSRYIVAAICLIAAVLAVYVPVSITSDRTTIADVIPTWYEPFDPPNTPLGQGKGIYPGRVVWVYEPDATSWDGQSGYWWEDQNTDQQVVTDMLTDAICNLASEASTVTAWDSLFKNFNFTHGNGNVGYQAGQKIAIKLNLNMINKGHYSGGNGTFTAPQVVLALLRQLVNDAGVDDNNITFFDASRFVPDAFFDRCKVEFPDVHFVGREGGDGREQYLRDTSVRVHWSDDLKAPTELGGRFPTYLPTCVTDADYMINLANMKGHRLAGITGCAKNHFGTICADSDYPLWGHPAPSKNPPKAAGIHPYVAVHYTSWQAIEWTFQGRPMGTYNPLVDLMGHEHLGGKTILYMIDGLYAANYQNGQVSSDCKWQSAPFNNDWTSSILVSQDAVAIDSVELDFIRNEPAIQNHPYMVLTEGDSVDNYLHEAALADNPPSGAPYDPETAYDRSVTQSDLESLGAHEHWNNAVEKKYTRNLGTGIGIELRIVSSVVSDNPPPPPTAPTGLAATAGNEQVSLDWNDNTEPDLADYNIYRDTSSGGPYSPIATDVLLSAYTDTGLSNGTTYYYVVTAVDNSDNESADSGEASATPEALPGGSVESNPTDDALVNHNLPDDNFGSVSYLAVRSDATNKGRHTFLKFTVSGVSGSVTSAKLKLYSVDVTMNVDAKAVSDTTWTEGTITWNNQPAAGSTLDTKSPGTASWVEFDVTSHVTGNGTYSFCLQGDYSTSGQVFDSKEDTNKPVLIVNY
jgi:hypothetical protein